MTCPVVGGMYCWYFLGLSGNRSKEDFFSFFFWKELKKEGGRRGGGNGEGEHDMSHVCRGGVRFEVKFRKEPGLG